MSHTHVTYTYTCTHTIQVIPPRRLNEFVAPQLLEVNHTLGRRVKTYLKNKEKELKGGSGGGGACGGRDGDACSLL